MDIMLAYCGLDCSSCPLHLATLETDKSRQREMRADIACLCAEHYKMDVLLEDINDCDGCRAATGNLFTGCAQCGIRKCATDKHLESCAYCDDYACEILKAHWQLDPGAQVRLEGIRNAGGKINLHQA